MSRMLNALLRRRYLGLLFVSALVLGTPAVALGGNNVAPNNQACGTPAGNGVTSCFPSIQDAVNYAGAGGTVNVGPGHYAQHVVLQNGVTLRGSGHDTVITGNLTTPLISLGFTAGSTSQFPVTIEYLALEATSGSATGYMVYVKDRNPANVDTISNVWFTEKNPAGVTPQRDYGLYNVNSTATLSLTNNTLRGMSVGMIIEANAGNVSGPLGADYVNDNRFDNLVSVGAGKVAKGIDVSVNGANSSVASQVFDGNEFDFDTDTGSAIIVEGGATVGSVSAHDNGFDGPEFGVNVASGSGNVDATDNWWGCSAGPLGAQKECSKVFGSVSYTPWLTSRPPNPVGAKD
jgi:hypothetical protein